MGRETLPPMHYLPLVLLLALSFAGCSRPPASAPEQKPPPVQETAVPAAPEKTAHPVSFVGTWAVGGDHGHEFDLVAFPNGQAVSNRTDGQSGAKGQRGFWRTENNRLLVFFQDGSTDVIFPNGTGFAHKTFGPGVLLESNPSGGSSAKRVEGDGFIGVWRLNKEPDGSFLYVALFSSGRAFSTISGGTEGKWEQTKDGALCKWPDGWNDLIFATKDGYQKRSWVGPAGEETTPPDISPALRVGSADFSITP